MTRLNRYSYQRRKRPGNLCMYCGKHINMMPRPYRLADIYYRPVLDDFGMVFDRNPVSFVQATAHHQCAIDANPDDEYI